MLRGSTRFFFSKTASPAPLQADFPYAILADSQERKRFCMHKGSLLTKPFIVGLIACGCCALWGSAYPCIKLGYAMFSVDTASVPSVILFAGMRFFLAGWLALAIGSIAARQLLAPRTKRTWRHIGILSLFQTILQYFLFYIGLAHTSGVKGSIIGSAGVFAALLVAVFLFRQERMEGRKLLGCVVGFAGVVLINLGQGGLGGGFAPMGEGFLLLSTVSYAFSSVFLKRFSAEDDPVLLSGWQFVLGGAVMILAGTALGGRVGALAPLAPLMLLYLGCISAVAYSLWGILLKYNPVSRVTVFSFMTPVFGVLLSAALLRETNTPHGAVCAAALVLVCIGICLVNRAGAPKDAPADTITKEN